ncbi:MAG: ABC transporter permease [Candidatus Micrarchaeota archaeon]
MREFPKTLSLLKREYWGVKTNTLLLVILLAFPMTFGFMFGTFTNIIPKNAPAAVFPEAGATGEDVSSAEDILSFFSKTSVEPEFNERKLFREEYYFFVGVPKGFRRGDGEVDVYIDASMSPIAEISPYVKDMILYEFSKVFDWEPRINIIKLGSDVLPFQYFVPGVIILLTSVVGLIILPFSSSRDRLVFGRVLANVSVPAFVTSKLVFAVMLALIQLGILVITQLAAGASGSTILDINVWSLSVICCSAVFFASAGMSVMFLTRFSEAGKQINAGLLGFVLMFSGAFYPVGFFPSIPGVGDLLQSISRANPSYLFVLLMRGFGIRGLGPELFTDYIAAIVVWSIASILLFAYTVRRMKND